MILNCQPEKTRHLKTSFWTLETVTDEELNAESIMERIISLWRSLLCSLCMCSDVFVQKREIERRIRSLYCNSAKGGHGLNRQTGHRPRGFMKTIFLDGKSSVKIKDVLMTLLIFLHPSYYSCILRLHSNILLK